MKKFLILMTTLIALLAVSVPFTSAQDCPTTGTPITKTVTETQINSSFRVTNPINRSVSNVYVDLQPGQVLISETYTGRSSAGAQTAEIAAVYTPTITNGRVYWNVVSITANGQPASAELIAQINASLSNEWRRWMGENGPVGVFTAVTITDTDITYTYTPWVAGCVPPPITTNEPGSPAGTSTAITYTEMQINSSFRVTNPANRSVSNEYVNLQPGQVTITATVSWQQRATTQSAAVAVVVTPTVSNGRVDWSVLSITANGQPASPDLVAQINVSLEASWQRWVAANAPTGIVTAVTITENDITYTYTPRL